MENPKTEGPKFFKVKDQQTGIEKRMSVKQFNTVKKDQYDGKPRFKKIGEWKEEVSQEKNG